MGARDGNERQHGAGCTCKWFVILCKHLLVGKPGTSSDVIASKGRKQQAWKKVQMSSHSVCSEYAEGASVPSPVCIRQSWYCWGGSQALGRLPSRGLHIWKRTSSSGPSTSQLAHLPELAVILPTLERGLGGLDNGRSCFEDDVIWLFSFVIFKLPGFGPLNAMGTAAPALFLPTEAERSCNFSCRLA